MGFEGANVLFDTWVHPLMMGLEEHLLSMFREDFEFADGKAPSHLGGHAAEPVAAAPVAVTAPVQVAQVAAPVAPAPVAPAPVAITTNHEPMWTPDAEKELKKIPFFVRGKARRNTERFAAERGLDRITLETLYDAKAHFRN
jgi:light-independent protochlorophyllide reductase subunit B